MANRFVYNPITGQLDLVSTTAVTATTLLLLESGDDFLLEDDGFLLTEE